MRYIAIFLLVANLGYVIWNFTQTDQLLPGRSPGQARENWALLNTGITLVSEFTAQSAEQERPLALLDVRGDALPAVGDHGGDGASLVLDVGDHAVVRRLDPAEAKELVLLRLARIARRELGHVHDVVRLVRVDIQLERAVDVVVHVVREREVMAQRIELGSRQLEV